MPRKSLSDKTRLSYKTRLFVLGLSQRELSSLIDVREETISRELKTNLSRSKPAKIVIEALEVMDDWQRRLFMARLFKCFRDDKLKKDA